MKLDQVASRAKATKSLPTLPVAQQTKLLGVLGPALIVRQPSTISGGAPIGLGLDVALADG
jgi:hypothetical protein